MQATRAADRGVKVRIYLDGTQLAEREPAKVFRDLAETPRVEIRTEHPAAPPQELPNRRAVAAHGRRKLSTSALKRQDNDLIVIESAEAAVPLSHQ